jgi:hypothetical protein
MIMSKTLSIITASLAASLIIFLSVAHACPGHASKNSFVKQSAVNMATSDSSPCGKAKPDVCKSVRDSMVSVKPSDAGVSTLTKTFSASPPSLVSSHSLYPTPFAFAIKTASHLVFKLPVSFSHSVLRI